MLSISADGWLNAVVALALFALAAVLTRRSTWHTSVDQKLEANKDEHNTFNRRFQRLKDKHDIDTTIED